MALGELSTLLVWGATTAYAIALVAFAVDLARLSDSRVAVRSAGGQARAASVGAGSGGGTVVLESPTEARDVVGRGRAGRAVGIAMATTTLGLLLEIAGTVLRGLAAGRVPWANMYEFTLMGSLAAVTTFLVLCRRRDVRFLGTIVVGVSVVALGLGLTAFYVRADPVEPALQSYWLLIHVSIATIASGLLTVSFAASVLQLLKDSRDNGSPHLVGRAWRLLDGLPSVRELEGIAYRVTAVGFVLWTFTVMAGAIWAEHAWGRYWGWDPKEVWSFVIWVIYAAYLHARTTRGWSGRRAAWFVVVGYAAVIFNFTGVNLLFSGKHAYSGLNTDDATG
jgi:cytochrome c-type biogenesis protein CcsB